ncbi:hypothetical protein [Clostridium ganghwense]|uniref:Small EDRK-rich factor-like N-terminal domain-containing protein n=1 Tax=Clostridium ganghwense TaxID=312089 RepID=A0ABT4CP15_9CLOT|nr:hypothetical protein [Clostridium ganghwense]MCY6370787.1 hypothetical protein [Clostridium ganghwense]
MAKRKKQKAEGNNRGAEKRQRELQKVNMEAAGEFALEDQKKQAGFGNPKNQKK